MATVVGTVSFIVGQAYAIKADGTQRILMLGDEVYADEVIRTAADSQVEISMTNGESIALEGGQSWLVSAETYTSAEDYPVDEAVLSDDVASVEAIQQAILEGQDPTLIAEEAAAGNTGDAGSGGNEGSTFELIERTAAEGDPEAGYETIGLAQTQPEIIRETGLFERAVADTVDTAVVSMTGPGIVIEGETTTDYTVNISQAPTEDLLVTFNYTTTDADGNDYTAVNSVTILAGETTATFTIDTLDDALAEGDESFTVSIGSVGTGGLEDLRISPAENAVTTTIVDEPTAGPEDTALISITGAQTITEGETSTNYTVTVDQLAADVTSPITVELTYSGVAQDGTDFTGVASVIIPAGSNSVDFSIETLDDVLAEGSEDFTITIGTITDANFENIAADGTANSVDSTIVDDSNP
ncbi:retention module-containing protein, partial [Neptunomonas sp.]|uniref:retention module-containing protein n=1 Tax=Neptunomonas sp. TaxID=1971898 RepID=UPI00356A4DA3